MIAARLAQRAAAIPDRTLFSWPNGRLDYGECARNVEVLRRGLGRDDQPLAVSAAPDPSFYEALLALDGTARRVHLIPEDLDAETVKALAGAQGFVRFDPSALAAAAAAPSQRETEIVLLTSGTSGPPKSALHTWESIAARIHVSPELEGTRWLLTYGPATYAGLQVFLHALLNGGQLSFGPPRVAELAELARRDGCTHVSGTPTFFRLLLSTVSAETLAGLAWTQITLGGEPVDQAILDALKRRFPRARLTHVYASTEAGVGFSVHDGRAGFPAAYLDDPGTGMQVVDDELQLRTSGAMRRYLDEPERETAEWVATGDLVRIDGDRVFFLGRRTERINVGGSKLLPSEVEQILNGIDGVSGARVYGTPNPLTGQIVCADIVAAPGADPAELRARIQAECRARLQAFKVPRILRFVDQLDVTAAGKLAR